MSADKSSQEWHLTIKGWTEGTYRIYGDVQKPGIVEPPIDRVETLVREMYQSSGYSKEDITWKRLWKSPNCTEEYLLKLKTKYPRPEY